MNAAELGRFAWVIFDLDGVLVDTSSCHSRAYADLWAEIGLEGPAYADIAGQKTVEVVARVTADLTPTEAQLQSWTTFKQERVRRYIASEDIAFADTLPTLRKLRAAGMPLALGTGASRRTVETVLARLGLADFFAVIATAEDARRGKPAPDIYEILLRWLNADPDRALVVEDSSAGLAAALASGAHAAAVRTGHGLDHRKFIGRYTDLSSLFATLNF